MRAYLIIPVLVIVPFIVISLLRALSGEALGALVVALILLVTVIAWFAGASGSSRRATGRR